MKILTRALLIMSLLSLALTAAGQTEQLQPRDAQSFPSQTADSQKIDPDLVTVPVIASAPGGAYILDLRKDEFRIVEDGMPQEVAFLATGNAPFHLVLLLDTSNSTQDKLPQIQQAAIAFLQNIGPADRVKVISFDGQLHELNDFTNDKAILRAAIAKTHSGNETRVYDAMQLALDVLRPIQTRKAIIIFTDGVDWQSHSATSDGTIRDLEESGVIVYPIRFETRAATEQEARKQSEAINGGALPTSDVIRQSAPASVPTTDPSEEPTPVPSPNQGRLGDLVKILGGRVPPNTSTPDNPFPQVPAQGSGSIRRAPSPGSPRVPPVRDEPKVDPIKAEMDQLYSTADNYLSQIAERSGGRLSRADTVASLPQTFTAIATELRAQYLLGYYATNKNDDDAYRKILVTATRKEITIRARPGYRPKSGSR